MEGTDYETFGFLIPSQVIITIGSDGQLLIVNSSAAPGQIANCGTNLIARQRDSRSYVHPMVVSARRHMYLLERAWHHVLMLRLYRGQLKIVTCRAR
jgi:hypothetical protein